MIIKIDPLDTLFFRDGKPFTMGEDTWANGIFPPSPSVVYGALRSAYFSNHIDELEKANQDDDPTKGLKIKGMRYGIGNDIYYLPLPYDCVKEKDDKNKPVKVSILSMRKNESLNSCPTEYLLSDKDGRKVENVPNGFIRKSILEKYLIQNTPEKFSIKKIGDYVLLEPKIGIGIDKKTGTSEEGKLYRVDMRRLSNEKNDKVSIIVDFEGFELPERGMMKLGGEGKAVSYEGYSKDIPVDAPITAGNMFKIYLSTPAILKNGWLPEWIDEKTLISKYNKDKYEGPKLKLLTASAGKPVYIGGFDMKKRKPKPMYKAVPAGSVYYFEIIEGDAQDVIDAFHGKSISDYYEEQGFGIAYVGGVGKNA